ncbi:terminase [Spirochaetia bacterium]|nr:terminase [Spirochaetia bacterium]
MQSPGSSRIFKGDLDFLIEQFSRLTDSLRHEKPSDFIERVRTLTADLTPFPGRFSFDRFPYFRKILDCFDPMDPTREVVLMKGNQLGATTALIENLILYHIMCDPKPQMYVTADAGLMKTSVAIRVEKMFDSSGARPLLFSQSQKKAGSRNTGDTAIAKEYPGGYLHFYGGKSPARFRGISYPVALVDEVDAFPDFIKDEGTVIKLIRSRTNAFEGKYKILWTSTPLIKQTSKIEPLYLRGDQEKFYVPCKHCGEMQELVWHGESAAGVHFGIIWENDERFMPIPESVAYKCRYCGGLMKNYDKATVIPRGEWRATIAKPESPTTKSFHLSPLYNPPGMYSWESMVQEWSECWDIEHGRLRDKENYRAFRNLKQGLTFEELGVQIQYERAVQFRRSGFARGKVPNDLAVADTGGPVLIVTAAVDVQKDRLYVDVKGYSCGGVTWTLDFFAIEGDTEQFNGPWDQLNDYLDRTRFTGSDGKIYRIMITLIDSGHNADYVYQFCRNHNPGVYACKGRDYFTTGESYQLFSQAILEKIGGLDQAYHVSTGKLKDKISNSMTSLQWTTGQPQPWWYPNFPEDFRDDYFRMFEAETKQEIRDKVTNQWRKTIWKQAFGMENHAFDTYVYNLAALEIFAEFCCRDETGLNLPALNWEAFWEIGKLGAFYTVPT